MYWRKRSKWYFAQIETKDGYIPRDFLQIEEDIKVDNESKQSGDGSNSAYDGMVQIYVLHECNYHK